MKSTIKSQLRRRIKGLEGLTNEERSQLLELLETKTYGLVWENKPENVEEKLKEKLPVLTEVTDKRILSEDRDAPNHILIEGDNLEALTVLAYTYEGKIDLIYIDPPYNTGNKDFKYNDNYVDAEDGYRHSKWLSFMAKRLRIARQLLSDKGVIFISIDDNEQAQLKLLCDEVFGAKNFVATFPWRKRTAKSDVPHGISQDYEWVVSYSKSSSFMASIKGNGRKYYETPDFPNRRWRIHDLTTHRTAEERPNSFFTIVNPANGKEYPANALRTWAVTKETFEKYYSENRIVFPGDYDFLKIKRPVLRYWEEDDKKKAGETFGKIAVSTFLPKEVGMSQDGTKEVSNIFNSKIFSFPKPTSLIRFIISMLNSDRFLILDFFAGSGTTLHATMQLNNEDGGHRQCILVTNNENNICEEVTYERNRRVIQGYTNTKGEKVAGLTHNNLRYYKTKFIGRERTPKNMRELMRLSTDMLCIKENLYDEKKNFAGRNTINNVFRFFDNGTQRMLIIYQEEAVEESARLIAQTEYDNKIKVYVFSPSEDPWEDTFAEVADKVELCALPQAIYNTYRRILPKEKDMAVSTEKNTEENMKNNQRLFNFDEEEKA